MAIRYVPLFMGTMPDDEAQPASVARIKTASVFKVFCAFRVLKFVRKLWFQEQSSKQNH